MTNWVTDSDDVPTEPGLSEASKARNALHGKLLAHVPADWRDDLRLASELCSLASSGVAPGDVVAIATLAKAFLDRALDAQVPE